VNSSVPQPANGGSSAGSDSDQTVAVENRLSSGVGASIFQAQALSDCWNEQGVFGNSSCPDLHRLVHCRNCPVYSAAAARVLDRPSTATYREECTRQYASPRNPRELGTGSLILFCIGFEWLALPSRCFKKIAERRPVHSLPHQRKFLLGLANVRGELLLCVSLAHFLGLSNLPDRKALRTAYNRLLVLDWSNLRICFPCQQVQGPRRFSHEDLKVVPVSLAKTCGGLTTRILQYERSTVSLLDPNLLCSALSRSLP